LQLRFLGQELSWEQPLAPDGLAAWALARFLKATAATLRAMLRADVVSFLESTAAAVSLSDPDGGARKAWAGLRVLTAFGGGRRRATLRPLPQRRRADGALATSAAEVDGIMLKHFAAIESAQVCGWDELAVRHLQGARGKAPLQHHSIDNVCSLSALTALFRGSQPGRAGGPDAISDDFFRAAPDALARLYHPLLVKIALLGREPILVKGGIAVPLYKGSGAYDDPNRFRSILLNSVVCKHYHRFLRTRLLFLLQAVFLRSQCGGLPMRGADLAAHTVRSFLVAAKARRCTAAILYVDLWSGFYTVVRQLVFRASADVADRDAILDGLSLPPECREALMALMAEPSMVDKVGLDPHLAALLAEAHEGTWLSVDGRAEVARTRRGSRPGCALADLVFNLAFAPALTEAGAALREQGLLWELPVVPTVFVGAGADPPPPPCLT
jgi:hypothetical protein